jgi:hypothetical protein
MRIWGMITVVGTIVFLFGIIFHLQGQSVIGPESSFMYANPEWVFLGIQIAVLGIVISAIGISIKLIRKANLKP